MRAEWGRLPWPADPAAIQAEGFSHELLPILMEAVENGHVEWCPEDKCVFDYLGFRYEVGGFPHVRYIEQTGHWIDSDVGEEGTMVLIDLKTKRELLAMNAETRKLWGSW